MNSPHSLPTHQNDSKRRGKLIVVEGTDGSGKTVQTHLLVERLLKAGYQVQMTDFPQYGKSFFADMIERYLNGEFGWPQELKKHLKNYPLPKKRNYRSDLTSNKFLTKITNTEGIESKVDEVNPYLSSLLYAGDRWEMKDQLDNWLDEGNIIISNRYVCSNMAHQGAKIKDIGERNKFFKWIEELEYKVYAIPRPNLTIYLHVSIDVSQELIKARVKGSQGFKPEADLHEEDINYLKKVQDIYTYLAKEDSSWFTIGCTINNQILPKKEIAEKVWNIINKN